MGKVGIIKASEWPFQGEGVAPPEWSVWLIGNMDTGLEEIQMRRLRTIYGVVITILVAGTAVQANLVINGDIEDNTAVGTMFNMSNDTFNATVAHATAFGTSQEIDLVTGLDYGIAPQSGNWKLGLHQRSNLPTNVDAFSFDLSSPVVNGSAYLLRFFAAGLSVAPLGPVEIGLSGSASDFGTLIFSGTPGSATEWTQFDYAFVAPIDASFLTVRNAAVYNMYAFVDNFSLSDARIPAPGACHPLGDHRCRSGRLAPPT